VLEKVFTMLGVGMANLVSILDPDLIVVGGGITRGAPEFLLATVEKVVKRIHPQSPPVKLSSLQGKAQIYGAVFSALRLARSSRTRGRASRG
jgi:predicted NBD/HSP70 family sugar kinase